MLVHTEKTFFGIFNNSDRLFHILTITLFSNMKIKKVFTVKDTRYCTKKVNIKNGRKSHTKKPRNPKD